jgi:hypothetical protein
LNQSDDVIGPSSLEIVLISPLFVLLILIFSAVFSLYNQCQWDDKAVRRLVGDGKLAARLKGGEDRTPDINQECPICFLYYEDINVTKCCSAQICTECFLQVRPQKEKHANCPFCNSHKLSVSVAKKMTAEQLEEQEKEEQQVIEARIRSQSMSENSDGCDNNGSECFGSSLKMDSRVALMQARSESFASNNSAENNNQKENIMSLAMTPEERQRLEEEMKAQLSHPLHMRVEAEAEERRIQNDRAFSRISNAGGSSRELRAQRAAELFRRRRRGGRDWNQIVDAFERGGNGEIHSLDDLVVLEAAILLSMDEESRHLRPGEDSFDAARHARDGFPLVRSFFANRREEGSSSEAELGSGSRLRQQVLSSGGGSSSSVMGNTALDTAAMLMRGISEADQVAMAIAASLQDHNSNSSENEEENQDDNNESTNNEEDNSDDEEVYHDNDEEGHDIDDDDGDDDDDDHDDDNDDEEEQNLISMVESNNDDDDDDDHDHDNYDHDDDDDHEMQDTTNIGDEDVLNEEANDRIDAEPSEDNGPTEEFPDDYS